MSQSDRSPAVSRPSKNNRQGCAQGAEPPESGSGRSTQSVMAEERSDDGRTDSAELVDPADLPGETGLRPLSAEERKLRQEATLDLERGVQSRQWYRVVNEWRDWYTDYESMHIEYEGPDGQTVRTELENSYMPEYGKRYYARLKDLERGIEREYESLTTAMLTFSASTRNANDGPRCPADHMREISDGWRTARKQLHQVLSGVNWQYARVWEPHSGGSGGTGGYGHLHVAVFVDADDLDGDVFAPVLDTYTDRCDPAGTEAHTVENAVSVNDEVENLGSYISEYIGVFGERPVDRPVTEQMFYAVTWATQTRRLDFSNGAQEIIADQKFRRETGLRPEDRGGCESDVEGRESDAGSESETWAVDSICTVSGREPRHADPTTGGATTVITRGRDGIDPTPEVD